MSILIAFSLMGMAGLLIFAIARSLAAGRQKANQPPKRDPWRKPLGLLIVSLGMGCFILIVVIISYRLEYSLGAFFYGLLGIALIRGGLELINPNPKRRQP